MLFDIVTPECVTFFYELKMTFFTLLTSKDFKLELKNSLLSFAKLGKVNEKKKKMSFITKINDEKCFKFDTECKNNEGSFKLYDTNITRKIH